MIKTSLRQFVLWMIGAGIVFSGMPVPAALAQSSSVAAELVSVTPAGSVKSGAETRIDVVLRNTGSKTWSNKGDNAAKIATVSPQDRLSSFYHEDWLSNNRVAVAAEKSVKPGKTAKFSFLVTAGGKPGLNTEKFGLVVEGVAWASLAFDISLNIATATYSATLGSNEVISLELKAGETAQVTTKLRNTGDAFWQNQGASGLKLGTIAPYDRASSLRASNWLSANRVGFATKAVKGGEEAVFDWSIQAPVTPATYTEEFGFVVEGVTWLSPKIKVVLKVTPAIYKASWVKQSESVSVAPGDVQELWVEFKNQGNTVWKADGPTPVRLGTAGPLDRVSNFYDTSWVSQNRAAAMTPAEVKPGEVARFTFKIQGAGAMGSYKEYFRPVVDSVTWLDDVGLYWDIKVEEEVSIQSLMRVGLTSTTTPVTISGESFSIRKGNDTSIIRKFNGESVTITPVSGGFKLSTGETVRGAVRAVPMQGTILTVNTSGISSSYNSFRGSIVVERSALNNVWVVNHLDLEDYMKGIAEVPESWTEEAQKAQVVAARTYGVKKRSESAPSDIFDVYDDTRHQVYYGHDYEVNRPKLVKAVAATKGLVMKYGGQVISAYFFSDSGGATEDSQNVWGKGNPALAIPYLKGVNDPYAKPLEWSVTLTQSYLKQRFDEDLNIAAGAEDITKIEITERFPSQRIKTAEFTMSSGRKVSVPFYRFDYLTNNNDVKSMRFEVQAKGSSAAPDFEFEGEGWGHGVGLPQWSARNMADKGMDFKKILTYFYSGVSIEKI